jgi:3-oxoacyl-[acyl-carrier protein] reductase
MGSASAFHDKIALVTGGGRGIGRAIALRFGAAGARVVVASRTGGQLAETCRLIEQGGGLARAVACDVTDAEDVARLIEEARSAYGGVDILVNGAGVAPLGTIDQMTPEIFDEIIRVNVRAVYLCSRAAWPVMVARGGGAIVNIASVAAYDAFPGFAAYGAAKAFVVAYTKELAKEGAAVGIRLHGVAPGAVETGMLRGAFPEFPAAQALDPTEVAAMVETVLSPAYANSSGETVKVVRAAERVKARGSLLG